MRNDPVLTDGRSLAIPRAVGRKRRWAEDMQARFPEGTFARIEAVLDDGEDRTDFVRAAVEREIKRRERAEERKLGQIAEEYGLDPIGDFLREKSKP